jgi:hypothetical protein
MRYLPPNSFSLFTTITKIFSITTLTKYIPVTGSETVWLLDARLVHFLENRLRYGGEVVSLTLQPPFTTGRFLIPFRLEAERVPGSSAAGRIV